MKLIATLVLIVGVALAGGAIYVTSKYFDEYEARLADQNKDVKKILVAKVDMPYGTALRGSEHLEYRSYPIDLVPEGAFEKYEDLVAGEHGQSPRVTRDVDAGLPVLKTMLSGFGGPERMSFKLADGKRAFSIKINAVSGVSGFIAPGDRVDVMLTRRAGDALESSIIMQNMLVIALDQKTASDTNAARVASTATVEVTPEEAQKLSVAQQLGALSLTLRGLEEDAQISDTGTIDAKDVLGIVEQQRQRGPSVTIRKGGTATGQVTFE